MKMGFFVGAKDLMDCYVLVFTYSILKRQALS